MHRSRLKPLSSARPRMAIVLAFVLAAAGGSRADTSVFRCTSADGSIEFRQHPCPGAGDEIIIEDRAIGWTPPAGGTTADQDKKAPRQRKPASAEAGAAAARKRDDQCWNKRRQLEEVNWKLRRGYAPAKGVDLRRKRRSYEDYIDRFCR